MNLSPDRKDYAEIDALLRSAVRCALDIADFKSALNSFRRLLPEVAPSLVAQKFSRALKMKRAPATTSASSTATTTTDEGKHG